ncbi:hypothetical protein F4778DRAFT_113599 [Xylariomycetidae sp. FL2044]|nr:hypothetical protein F4778DRAFT_113599 [Xylariomycetidae sp. FL2044]
MSSPTEYVFAQLSLGSMPPTTRLQTRRQQEQDDSEPEPQPDDSHSDSESEPGFEVDESTGVHVTLPSGIKCSLAHLHPQIRHNILTASQDTSSKLVLRRCQSRNDDYIFLVSELAEYTIRTGVRDSQWTTPSCSCERGERGEMPCRHTLWLFDRIASQIWDYQKRDITLVGDGYYASDPELDGKPFDFISDFHLDMLADSLHCDVVGQSDEPNPRRVQTTREILACLNEVPVDEYRPDLFDNPRRGKRAVKKGDLEQTIFRMLISNDEFFHYFLSSMEEDEMVINRFRRLQHRADLALAGLRDYASNPAVHGQPGQKDVDWCARHLDVVAHQLYAAIVRTNRRLRDWELRAAGRTLVHILHRVVDHNTDVGPPTLGPRSQRNLYFRLVGDRDDNFVVKALFSIPPVAVSHLIDELATIEDKILRQGAPQSYVARLRACIDNLRSSHVGAATQVSSSTITIAATTTAPSAHVATAGGTSSTHASSSSTATGSKRSSSELDREAKRRK